MIDRYTRPGMGHVFSEAHKYELWLAVELAMCEAREAEGAVPDGTAARIRAAARVNPRRVAEIEAVTRHDVIAFLTAVAESVGPESRFLHWGMTSSDLLDTALSLQLREAGALLVSGCQELLEALAARAREHRRTVMVGRTHGMHAEPTTFGLKLLGHYHSLRHDLERLERAVAFISAGKFSGAVGTLAQLSPALEEAACARLRLTPAPVTTQVIARDRHAEFLSAIAFVGASLERLALEVRHLQRTEVGEVEEPFVKGQKGSSAMPHKRNPIHAERLCGLSRLLRAHANVGLENIPLWHERDISHSSAERVILPDSCITLDYMLHVATELVRGLVVRPERMRANLDASRGLVFSEGVLLALVDAGLAREAAYTLVQGAAMRTLEESAAGSARNFLDHLSDSADVVRLVPRERLAKLFDLDHALRHVDALFERVLR
ncbi:MAG: adenylosuccinate lyase [Candidatus Eisenbacteria bacterium]|nr:adenylosuccinate lyase [Candidatus Eisenbacteria bacterium]